jgi:hypothetical protein
VTDDAPATTLPEPAGRTEEGVEAPPEPEDGDEPQPDEADPKA